MNNEQVAHAWAHGHSGKGSNLTTDGVDLKSYSTVIAKTINGVHFISLDNMTPTTSKHLGYAKRAVSYQYFASPGFDMRLNWPDLSAAGLIKAAAERARADIERIFSSRARQGTKLYAAERYTARRDEILAMAARFDVQITMPEYVASPEEIAAYQEKKKAADAAKEAARVKEQKKRQKEDKKQLDIWLTTGAGRCPGSYIERGNDFITLKPDSLLIAAGTAQYKIITSQGAECPLDHAVKALRFYNTRRRDILQDDGRGLFHAWKTDGHKIPLGIFTLDSIDEAGTVKAGCHTFSAAEIQRFINQWREVLGL